MKLASDLTGESVLRMSFSEVDFNEKCDGICVCASLLHVSRNEMKGILEKLAKALKPNGIFYSSFKYEDKEEVRKGRLFNDYNESTFQTILCDIPQLKLIQYWRTSDARPERKGKYWLNVLLRKTQ